MVTRPPATGPAGSREARERENEMKADHLRKRDVVRQIEIARAGRGWTRRMNALERKSLIRMTRVSLVSLLNCERALPRLQR
jgi:hypothetical protein